MALIRENLFKTCIPILLDFYAYKKYRLLINLHERRRRRIV